MTLEERNERQGWLAEARGRSGLRIVIVTGELSVPWLTSPHRRFVPESLVL